MDAMGVAVRDHDSVGIRAFLGALFAAYPEGHTE